MFAPLRLVRLLMQARRLRHRPRSALTLLALTLGMAALSRLTRRAVRLR